MTNDSLQNLIKSRCGGRVERCHTFPAVGPSYTNAAHSWGVAMILFYLWPEDFSRLGIYCLTHDIGEAWTGDIPAPVMWNVPGLADTMKRYESDLQEDAGCPREDQLAPEDAVKLKACDRLELYLWCKEQILMGNLYAKDCCDALEEYFTFNPLPERAHKLFIEIANSPIRALLPKQQGVMQELVNGERSGKISRGLETAS